MDIQKAIKYFDGYGSPYDDLVIQALEKQIPKPPEYIDYDTCYFKCGACSGEISWTGILEDHKYCLECGQATDMEGK